MKSPGLNKQTSISCDSTNEHMDVLDEVTMMKVR